MNALLPRLVADPSFAAGALLLLKVTLALAAASVLALLLRRRSAALRHDLWSSALVAALVLALLAPLVPAIELAWLPASTLAMRTPAEPQSAEAAPPAAALPPAAGNQAPATAPATVAQGTSAPSAPAIAPPRRLPAPRLATLFWMIGAALVLLRCALGHFGLRRLAAGARPLDGGDWPALLAETSARAGVQRPVRLVASAAVSTPVTWGARQPVVVLPADAERWPAERRRAALLHELAHVARGDYLAQLFGTAACALYWFHPLAWTALRGLRREAERACDDRVLAAGAAPEDYAAQLLEVARGAQAARLGGLMPAIGMARPSTLEGRLLALLDERVPRRSPSPRARLVAAA
ncbi:MAG TPA: M56 family metallopeptidase, partial [Thermoanaerobaculia bacterium]|nr:M56 family metallopeptidase [Thermoanaerobaculia bacterium]